MIFIEKGEHMKDIISVIIPIYNMEKYLKRCVESVCLQSYQELEIILVDDGSTDDSGKICEEYAAIDKRIKVIHKKNGGLSSARNAGLDVATGKYVGFLDSDDYISVEMYEQLFLAVSENDVACNLFVRVDEFDNILPKNDYHKMGGQLTGKEYLKELLLHIGDVSVCTKLFSKEVIGDIRFQEGVLNEDLLFIISVLPQINNMIYTGHVGYFYLTRSDSISSRYGKAIEDMVSNSLIVYSFVRKEYPDLEEEAIRFALYQHMAYLLMVPKKLAVADNLLYINALKFLRKNFLKKGVLNSYLSKKSKMIMLGQMIAPRLMSYLYQRKK